MGPIHDKHLVSCCSFRVTSAAAKTGISERQTTQQPKVIGANGRSKCKCTDELRLLCRRCQFSLLTVFPRFDLMNRFMNTTIHMISQPYVN